MDTPRPNWISQAEAEIRQLRDIDEVRIEAADGEIRAIQVVSRVRRPARLLIRDIQTLLLTRFQRTIDERVVAVSFAEAPAPPLSAVGGAAARSSDRIRFGNVNLHILGRRAQAQVQLHWKGVPRLGTATECSTREGALRLVASATLKAVQEFLDESIAFSLTSVEITRVGKKDVALVALELLAHRTQKSLVGCCTVEEDVQEAVVLATLSALNRIIGGLPTKEPTEYVVRPMSS